MITSLYAVVVKEGSEETLFAISSNSIYGSEGPMLMQVCSSKESIAEHSLKFAQKEFPDKEFSMAKFVRAQ